MAEREPVRWITVKGKHLPVYADGSIGVGQETPPESDYEDSLDYNDFVKKNLKKLKEVYNQHKHDDDGIDYVKEEWYKKRLSEEKKDIHEMDIEDAISTLREAIPDRILDGWFRRADSEYKPIIMDAIMANKGALNAGLNIAYYNYRYQFERYSEYEQKWIPHEWADQSKKMSFEKWLNTPQEFWRGDRGQSDIKSDVFKSFSTDKRIAVGFTIGDSGMHKVTDEDMKNVDPSKLTSIKIRPIDTLGSYQTTGEQEYLIPQSQLRRKKNGR